MSYVLAYPLPPASDFNLGIEPWFLKLIGIPGAILATATIATSLCRSFYRALLGQDDEWLSRLQTRTIPNLDLEQPQSIRVQTFRTEVIL